MGRIKLWDESEYLTYCNTLFQDETDKSAMQMVMNKAMQCKARSKAGRSVQLRDQVGESPLPCIDCTVRYMEYLAARNAVRLRPRTRYWMECGHWALVGTANSRFCRRLHLCLSSSLPTIHTHTHRYIHSTGAGGVANKLEGT